MQMKEYRISDLFEKVEVQKIQGKANDFPTKKDDIHTIPLLTSTGSNQGFSRYAAKEDCPKILQNVISIASNGDAGATFYQAEPFAVLQDAYAIQLKAHKMTETIGLYLAATIHKTIYDTHDWLTPPTIEIVGFLGGSCKAHHHAACQVASYAVSHKKPRVWLSMSIQPLQVDQHTCLRSQLFECILL